VSAGLSWTRWISTGRSTESYCSRSSGALSPHDESAVDRVADPKGDRVRITLNRKFQPYRTW
jgi:hypothetical protein